LLVSVFGTLQIAPDVIVASSLDAVHAFGDVLQLLSGLLDIGQCLESAFFQFRDRAHLVWMQLVLHWVVFDCVEPLMQINWLSRVNRTGHILSQELAVLFRHVLALLVVDNASEPVVFRCLLEDLVVVPDQVVHLLLVSEFLWWDSET